MSSMNAIVVTLDCDAPAVRPFALARERLLPSLERRRSEIESMYEPVLGRPEADPVRLMAVTALQIMARLPDRACAEACLYDARWRLALEACLESMREAGYLKSCKAVRIDSTHLLARIADMSRLECVRETLRLALEFLAQFGGSAAWEPWSGRYADRNPEEVLVDAGYVSAPALLKADAGGYALTGPMPAPPHSAKRFASDSFAVDLPGRVAVCPAGHASSECDRIEDAKYAQYGAKYYFAWPAEICAACPLREQCVSKKNKLARRTSIKEERKIERWGVNLLRILLLPAQRLEARDDVEQFFVDAALAQLMEGGLQILKQLVDVPVRALHRRQPARVLAREGFGARPEERDEQVFADERTQRRVAAAQHFRRDLGRPADFGESLLPLRIERQQPLTDRLVERPDLRPIMKNVQARIVAFGATRLAFNLDLPDERGDGLDRVRHGKKSHHGQARVRQPRMHALADGPDLGLAGQAREGLDRVIGHDIIELAHQSLIGAENDRPNGAVRGLPVLLCRHGRRPVFP